MRVLTIATLISVLLGGSAMAQQPSQAQTNAIKQSCRGDYQSYCSSIPPGGKASLQCLQQNLDALSPPCHDAVAALSGGPPPHPTAAIPPAPPPLSPRQEVALLRRSCGSDFGAYCAGVRPGGGRAIGCLMQNEARLSPQCRGALAEARQSR